MNPFESTQFNQTSDANRLYLDNSSSASQENLSHSIKYAPYVIQASQVQTTNSAPIIGAGMTSSAPKFIE